MRGLRQFRQTKEGTVFHRRIEITAQDRNGRRFPVELAITPVEVEGIYQFTAFVADITDRKRAQEQLEHWSQTLERRVYERTEALELANQKLQEFDRKKSTFLSIASHELRTPMTSIMGYVDNMLAGVVGDLSEKQTFYLSRIKENTARLIRFVSASRIPDAESRMTIYRRCSKSSIRVLRHLGKIAARALVWPSAKVLLSFMADRFESKAL
jgi:signal transduction histidine kinase